MLNIQRNNMMKKTFLNVILFATMCSGCYAQTNNQTAKNHVTANQVNDANQSKISLYCQGFELDYGDYLLCDYWHKSNRLNKMIDLKNFTKYPIINSIRDLSPADYAYHATTQLTFNGTKYDAYIYPNSRITLINPNKKVKSEMTGALEGETIEYICQNAKCKDMFLWQYVDEGIAGEDQEFADQESAKYFTLLNSLIKKSDNEAIKNIQEKGKLTVKIVLGNVHTEKRQYVFRNVSPTTPLKDAIQAYLDGATAEESKLGYKTNTLGIDSFNIKINDNTAYIAFHTDNLHINDAQEMIDFNYNVESTAQQFNSVKEVKICINGISNYQTAYFGSATKKKCEF